MPTPSDERRRELVTKSPALRASIGYLQNLEAMSLGLGRLMCLVGLKAGGLRYLRTLHCIMQLRR